MSVKKLSPLHPGEVLREEFMKPLGLTAYAVAKACDVPRTRIERIAREEIGITADSAIRLGRVFGLEPEFWINLQSSYDLRTAREALGAKVDALQPLALKPLDVKAA